MEQSPSWEANWSAGSQETPHISQNPKVHYRTHKRPPPVPILGQPNPVHIHTSHLLEIHPNIIRPSTPRSHQWSPSLQLSRVMKHSSPSGRRNHGRPLKGLLDTWDRNRSTSGPTPCRYMMMMMMWRSSVGIHIPVLYWGWTICSCNGCFKFWRRKRARELI